MKTIVALTMLLTFTGCASFGGPSQAEQEAHMAQVRAMWAETEAKNKAADAATPVTDEFLKNEAVIKKSVCAGAKNCSEKLAENFVKRLIAHYDHATQKTMNEIQAYPEKYQDHKALEQAFKREHFSNKQKIAAHEHNQEQEKLQRQIAEEKAEKQKAWAAFGDAMAEQNRQNRIQQQNQIQHINTGKTRCTSRNDGLGNVVTECDK